ncbi:signal peptidase II [bacterium]|nr:signal peptidase II [bacterium]
MMEKIQTQSKFTRRDLGWIGGIALAVFVLDLVTKYWAVVRLKGRLPIVVIDEVFRLAYGENTGIAFGLFQNSGVWLHILAPIAFVVLIYYIYKYFAGEELDFWYRLLFGLLIGGALGNILNRLYSGYVIDFLDVFIHTPWFVYHWPTFNIADSALTVGEVILIWKILFCGALVENREELKSEQAESN